MKRFKIHTSIAINLLNTLCNSTSKVYKVNIINKENPVRPKKPVVPRKKVNPIGSKKLISPIKTMGISDIENLIKPILKFTKPNLDALPKTHKQVIIVRDGTKVIYDKVWIHGAIGKFVQTNEKTIKQGDPNGKTFIEETIYYKAIYGYNSIKRTYTVP